MGISLLKNRLHIAPDRLLHCRPGTITLIFSPIMLHILPCILYKTYPYQLWQHHDAVPCLSAGGGVLIVPKSSSEIGIIADWDGNLCSSKWQEKIVFKGMRLVFVSHVKRDPEHNSVIPSLSARPYLVISFSAFSKCDNVEILGVRPSKMRLPISWLHHAFSGIVWTQRGINQGPTNLFLLRSADFRIIIQR